MELNLLNYWNIDHYRHYLSQVRKKEILTLSAGEKYLLTVENQSLLYMLSGEITAFLPEQRFVIQGHECFFAKKMGEYQLLCGEEESRMIVIDFQCLALSSEWPDRGISEFQPLLVNLPSHIPMKKQNSSQLLFNSILQELEKPRFDSDALIASSLSNILLQLLRLARRRGDTVLNNVAGAAFYSKGNHYHPLEAGRKIWFTDIHIWAREPENPDAEADPSLLGILKAHGAEVSIPNDGSLVLDHQEEPYHKQQVSCFTAVKRSPYHVWIWPSFRLHLDLRPIQEDYCITFHLKSNMTGNIGFTLTNMENYDDLPDIIPIEKKDVWIPVCITGHSLSESAPSSPYVIKAVMYIRQNYTKALRVGEVAEHCHISSVHLSRLFREQTGFTIVEFLSLQRIQAAKEMLLYTASTLEEIAHAVGFYDLQHFSRTFLHYTGLRPSAFRKYTETADDISSSISESGHRHSR